MHTIILDDGTEIEAELSMNTWKSDTEPDDTVFAGNTGNVSYITPEGDRVELGECRYIKGIKNNEGKYLFFLNPLTNEDKIIKQRGDIDYIAMMLDVELEV